MVRRTFSPARRAMRVLSGTTTCTQSSARASCTPHRPAADLPVITVSGGSASAAAAQRKSCVIGSFRSAYTPWNSRRTVDPRNWLRVSAPMTTASVPLKTGAGSVSLISLPIAGNCAAIRRIDQTSIHRQAELSTAPVVQIAIRLRMALYRACESLFGSEWRAWVRVS